MSPKPAAAPVTASPVSGTPVSGSPAPAFSLPADDGRTVSLAEFAGKKVVLYFYPKDDTPGCTKEACAFRDQLPDFSGIDAVVIGISKDSVAAHTKFKAKYDLPFVLLSDKDGDVSERYGVWKQKSMCGRTYMGIERSTFLIDGAGVIRQVWPKVKVEGHAAAVLKAARAL